jgi:hypothetical protein
VAAEGGCGGGRWQSGGRYILVMILHVILFAFFARIDSCETEIWLVHVKLYFG